jgi:hypothetical protein
MRRPHGEKALADKANKQCPHKTVAQEKALANDAESQCCRESAACPAALGELVSAMEQSRQESADCPAVSAETTLANERCCQKEAERGATLEGMALAAVQHHSLSVARAAELALAMEQVAVSADSLLPERVLAEDKRHQEEAAKAQRHADDKCVMAPALQPNPGNVAIRRIRVECALLAAPLDAFLAKIECYDIVHEAQALSTTTLPHPAAMLSTPPRPMTYVGVVFSTMGGST